MVDDTVLAPPDNKDAETKGKPRVDGTDKRRICVVLNPQSGKRNGDSGPDEVQAAFARNGLDVTLHLFDPKQDLSAQVTEIAGDGFDTIVAAGGDGTICGVTAGLVGADVSVGVIPLGTFNYFARSLGIEQSLDAAVDTIANGTIQPMRLGMLNDELYLNNANFGIYPEILMTREKTYARWGRSRLAAYWSVAKTVLRGPASLSLRIDADTTEHKVKTPMVFVFSNSYQLEQSGLEGADCVDDGQLALLIAPERGRLGLLVSGLSVAMGFGKKNEDFRLLCADQFEITAKRKSLMVARDGEWQRMSGPFRLSRQSQAINFIVPHPAERERQ